MMIDWRDTRSRNFGTSIQDFEDCAARQPDVFGDALVLNGMMNLSADDRDPNSIRARTSRPTASASSA